MMAGEEAIYFGRETLERKQKDVVTKRDASISHRRLADFTRELAASYIINDAAIKYHPESE